MIRIECPHCQTSYTAQRCGLPFEEGMEVRADIKCQTCAQVFHAALTPQTVPWYRKLLPKAGATETHRVDVRA